MRLSVSGALLVLFLFAGSGTSSAAAPWRTVSDSGAGFTIGVPSSWQLVPRSTPRLNALVVRLRNEKRTELANQFAQIAALRRATHTVFRFQAFAWPPPRGALVPDVTVKVDRLSAGTTQAALPYIAKQIAKALTGTSGATVSGTVARKLPAGRAMVITGTTQLSKNLRSRFSLYLLIHGRRLYSLSFRGPATPFESRIAKSLRWS